MQQVERIVPNAVVWALAPLSALGTTRSTFRIYPHRVGVDNCRLVGGWRNGFIAGMRCILPVFFFLMMAGVVQALSPEATREQVIAELGRPTSVARLGKREILNFPNGVKIEMENGRIVSTKGIELSDTPDAPVAAEAAPGATPAVKTPAAGTPAVAPPLTAEEKKAAEEEAAAEREFAKEQEKFAKTVESMAADQEKTHGEVPVAAFNVLRFIVDVLLKILLTVAALKLSCKYWGAEVFWSGIFIISAVDAGIRAAMILFGELVLGFPSLFYADEAVASVVMVLLLKKYSINRSTQQAVTIMFTTKTFSIVVGMFVLTVVLRTLF